MNFFVRMNFFVWFSESPWSSVFSNEGRSSASSSLMCWLRLVQRDLSVGSNSASSAERPWNL
jgi:hypothetical protein